MTLTALSIQESSERVRAAERTRLTLSTRLTIAIDINPC